MAAKHSMFDVKQGQLPFDLMEPETPELKPETRPGSEKLYFALLPDRSVGIEIDKLMGTLGNYRLSGRRRPQGLLHASIHGIGKYPKRRNDIISRAMQAAEAVKYARFNLVLDHVFSFRQPSHPLVLCPTAGAGEFRRLQLELGLAMYEAGLTVRLDSNYQPHITLQYGYKSISRINLEKPITWAVREFVLVRSLQGQSKHEYEGRWPLH